MTRIVLVDDHALVRAGVRAELEDAFSIVGEAGSVAEAVTLIAREKPDVVVCDVHLPSGTAANVIAGAVERGVTTVFLALSVSDAAEDVIDVIRAGARGYITKATDGEALIDAVRRVADGDAVFSPRLAGFVLDAFAGAGPAPEVADADDDLDQLTKREKEVLRHLARGVSRSRSSSPSSMVAAPDGPLDENASRTKPASRGEKTASPSCTRWMASIRSGPEIDLVT